MKNNKMKKSQLRSLIRETIKSSMMNKGSRTLQVTDGNGRLVLITDPKDIEDFLAGEEVYGEDKDGESIAVYLDSALDYQMAEGMSNEAIKEDNGQTSPYPFKSVNGVMRYLTVNNVSIIEPYLIKSINSTLEEEEENSPVPLTPERIGEIVEQIINSEIRR